MGPPIYSIASFALAPERLDYFMAAWDPYIRFNDAYDDLFDILRSQYSLAVGRLDPGTAPDSDVGESDRHLVQHLMLFYWRGILDLDSPDSLIGHFYKKASPGLRFYTMWFVGRTLGLQIEVSSEAMAQLKALWTNRLAKANESEESALYAQEMSAFGWWFTSGKLDEDWALDQLTAALTMAHDIDPEREVVERLAEISKSRPHEVLNCLRLLLEGDKEHRPIFLWPEDARTILRSALASGHQETHVASTNLIHTLGAKGHWEFRDLLK